MKGAVEHRFTILGRACHLVIADPEGNGESLLQEAIDELHRIESHLGTHARGSVIYRLNRCHDAREPVAIDAEASQLLDYASALRQRSNHVYDPSTGVLDELWSEANGGEPSQARLQARLQSVGWQHLARSADAAQLTHPDVRINLDACLCPYAVDRVRRLLVSRGVESALIDLDRDVATIGRQADGANWLLGLRYPRGCRAAIHRLKLNNRSFSLRGDFQQRLQVGGENFGRAYSPVDGYPLPSPLAVAVVAQTCLEACAAATVGRHLSESTALSWLSGLDLDWLAIDRELACHGPLARAGQLVNSP
jgi:FAD:protein FMN transferase